MKMFSSVGQGSLKSDVVETHTDTARHNSSFWVWSTVNSIFGQRRKVVHHCTMVQTYWDIGRMIVEEEQAGESRASYGQQQLQALSQRLAKALGKGFSVSNLKNMRRKYSARRYYLQSSVPT